MSSIRMASSVENIENDEIQLTADDRNFFEINEKQSRYSRAPRTFKAVCTFIFFIVLLGCFVWTKVSFLAITEAMHDDLNISTETRCRMFVMLQVMILVPNVFNLLRGLWNGWFRKDANSPDTKQVFMGLLISLLEAIGICLFTFNIPGLSTSHHVILIMNCVFVIPLLVWTVKTVKCRRENNDEAVRTGSTGENGDNANQNTNSGFENNYEADRTGSTGENGDNANQNTNSGFENNDEAVRIGSTGENADNANQNTNSGFEKNTEAVRTGSTGENGDNANRNSNGGIEYNDAAVRTGSNVKNDSPESKYLVIIALVFEIIALCITFYWLLEVNIQELIIAPIGILSLSFAWTSNIQNVLVKQKQNEQGDKKRPPTWKLVAIMAVFKLIFTFGISYLIFAVKELSPFPKATPLVNWSNYTRGWDWEEWQLASDQEIYFFVSHIVCGITGYTITVTASKARMQRSVLIPALWFCSPITIIVLVLPGPCHWIIIRIGNVSSTSDCIIGKNNDVLDVMLVILAVVLFLLAVTFSLIWVLWKTQYLCYLKEDQLFWFPSYNSIFLDQWVMLNRKNKKEDANHMDPGKMSEETWIYLCTTMYRETECEMKQFLKSIKDVQTAQSQNGRNVEAHIFFDDAFEAGKANLNSIALCLVRLVKSTLDLKKKSPDSESTEPDTYETPYGKRYSWTMGITGKHSMPLNIHFKDANKVKKKKRWSQIMYMSYVLDFLEQKDDRKKIKKHEHSYLLVTDADVIFTHKAVEYLIDLMLRDDSVGAACARTHPQGSGPLVWYQEFEYAIGHWFQKAAENVLGTVLCSPGCFSIYRCAAVKDVLPTYAEDVKCAFDVLTKDMGEDRWFCTLMIQCGWSIEYCAAASNKTHCPVNFEEFFKQRRRWIVSTLANLQLFLQNWDYVKRLNNRVSALFRFYQAALLFATIVGPSTIILVVSGGLKYGWGVNPIPSLFIQLVLCITFGLICVFTTSEMKISAAKVLTIFYSIIMTPVLVGMAVQITADFIQTEDAEPNYIDANIKVSTTTVYLCAMTGIFVITGILHTMEMFYLFHGIWYLLCLPGGYLILTIYSICNITDSSWGTREIINTENTKKKRATHFRSWSDMLTAIYKLCSCCAKKKNVKESSGGDAESGGTMTESNEGENNGSAVSAIEVMVPTGDDTSEPTTETLEDGEIRFWTKLVNGHLKPNPGEERFAKGLVELRNEWLMVLTVSNLLWLILITTLSYRGEILKVFGTSIVGLTVLVMLGILSLIQFLAMLTHRLSTFVHFLGREPPLFAFDRKTPQTDGDTETWTDVFTKMCKCCTNKYNQMKNS